MKIISRKILTSAIALMLTAGMCGCSVRFGTNSDSEADTSRVDSGEIVARPTVGEDIDDMSVSYGEFEREYLYYLNCQRIEDDTASNVADTCKERRKSIIDNLILEQVILKKAHELNVDTITDEEQKELDETFESEYENQAKYIGENASYYGYEAENSEESLSEEDIAKIGREILDKILEDSNMSIEVLKHWKRNSLITQKLMDELNKEVSRLDAEDYMNKSIEEAKALYESDAKSFESSGYTQIYLPEGSRYIKHILLGFSDEDMTEIQSLRKDGKDDEADTYRAQKAAELSDKVAEAEKKLDDGGDFTELVIEYSADASSTIANPNGYLVIPNGKMYVAEFQETAMELEKIGDRKSCVTDYGVHIMIYASDAEISSEQMTTATDNVLQNLQQAHFQERILAWKEEYKFQVEYDLLKIDNPDTPNSSSAD